MTDKSIEARIREHYVSDNGEWLVERGKVKEARLLKEACQAIEKLRLQYAASERNYYRRTMDICIRERDVETREKIVLESENRLRGRIESAKKELTYMLENMK